MAAWVMPLILSYQLMHFGSGRGTAWAPVQGLLSCVPSARTPGYRLFSEAGLKSGDRLVTDMWLQPSWCWGYTELPCQAQALPKLLTLGLMPHSCRWLLAWAVVPWHLHSSFRHKLMGLVGPRLDFPKVIVSISAPMSKLLSNKRNKM